jgi:tRNA A-37 threonylcarbamoyl transferase component Bud32
VYGSATPKLDALLADPEAVLAGPGILARELTGRKRFFRVDAGAAEPALYVKVFSVPPGAKRLRYFLRRSKARMEHSIAIRLARLGFEVAAPVAVGEERRVGVLERSYSVIRELEARDLVRVLGGDTLKGAERRALLERFAQLARKLHDAGVDQDDFAPNNFLTRPDGSFVLIDFERCRVRRRALGDRGFTQLAKLHRRDLGVSRSDRLRFLRAYLGEGGDRAKRREAWERIWPEFRRIRRHDARHAEASAFREGRNLAREGNGWVMRARKDARTIALELDAETARRCWLRAVQLERLGLPCLRPVRLEGGRVELLDPGAAPPRAPANHMIGRSLAALAPWGHFSAPPQWLFTAHYALLRNPHAFELDL